MVTIEDVEDGLEEAVGEEHAGGDDVDDGEALFGGDGFEGAGAGWGDGDDAGSFVFGVAGVEDVDGDGLLDGGEDGGGVEDLGAKVGEFGGFLEGDGLDAEGVGADAGVGGHDAVDVGPDFDGTGVEASTDEGGGVVGASSAQGGGDWCGAVFPWESPDEAAHDGGAAGFDVGEDVLVEGCFDGGFLGGGLAVVVVGEDAVAGFDVGSLEAALGEGFGDHAGGEALAEAGDEIVGAGGELADGGDAAEEVVEGVELGMEGGVEEGEIGGIGAEEGVGGVGMAVAEAGGDGEGTGFVSATGG